MSAKNLTLGYCPIGNGDSITPFDDVFLHKKDISKGMSGVDAVIFWGGTDIHPSLYEEPPHPLNQVLHHKTPSHRDVFEIRAMKYCVANNIPMIGVCRGAQLMCAFAGGSLIQDVSGHQGNHFMTTSTGEIIDTSSCHHQMMYPWDIQHELLAWSTDKRSSRYEDGYGSVDMSKMTEPEIVYFPTVNGLAIQGHPEWEVGTRFADYCNELVSEYLLSTVGV